MAFRPVQPYPVRQPYQGGRVRGLFIGINYRGSSAELNGCVNDVRTMLATLEKISFPLAEAVILVDDSSFPNCAGPPTKANIEAGMKWLTQNAQPTDTYFLHYSGHGSRQPNRDGTEASGHDETMIPLDYERAGVIVDNDIFNWLVRPLPPGARMTAVMDCCHSGTLMDLPYVFVATQEAMQTYAGAANSGFKKDGINRSDADVIMFSGCSDDQTSSDVTGADFRVPGNSPGAAGGACTGALADELVNTAGLSFIDMLLGVRQSLKRRQFKQVPQLSATKPINLSLPFSLFGPLSLPAGFAPPPLQNRPSPQQASNPPPPGYAPPPPPGAYPPPPPSSQPPQQPPYSPAGQSYPPPQGAAAPGYAPPPPGAPYQAPPLYPGAPGGQAYPPPPPPQQQQQQPAYPPPQQPYSTLQPAGYPPQQPGYPPQPQPGYPPYPPQQSAGYPPQQPGYPPQQPGYPAPAPGYPPQQPGYPPQQPGYPPPQPGYPPQQPNYAPYPGAPYQQQPPPQGVYPSGNWPAQQPGAYQPGYPAPGPGYSTRGLEQNPGYNANYGY